MGVYFGKYVGPFFKCVCPIVDMQVIERACSKMGCQNHKKNAYISGTVHFCPLCGSPIENVAFPDRQAKVRSFDVMEKTKEVLMVPHQYSGMYDKTDVSEVHLACPNIRPSDPKMPAGYQKMRDFFSDSESIGYEVFTSDVLDAERLFLQLNYEKEYQILCDLYGAENVTIRWGIISYAS